MNLFTKQKQRHGCREKAYGYQGMVGGGCTRRLGLTHTHRYI